MNDIILDRVAIWKPVSNLEVGKLDSRQHTAGTRYKRKGSNVYSSASLITRFVKNYKVGKTTFALFVRSDRSDYKAIEKELDEIAKGFKAAEVKELIENASFSQFSYLDVYLKGAK